MTLIYKPGYVLNDHALPHAVLDLHASDFFHDRHAFFAKKTAPTFAFLAKPGQTIETAQTGANESSFVCEGGEVVFVNKLPEKPLDIYVPRDQAGKPTGAQILQEKYTLISGDLAGPFGALYASTAPVVPILWEVIGKPTVIMNAWGLNNHQFLERGATLKIDGKSVTGIKKTDFDAAWAVTDEQGNILRPATPPSPDFYSPQSFARALHL